MPKLPSSLQYSKPYEIDKNQLTAWKYLDGNLCKAETKKTRNVQYPLFLTNESFN